LLARDRAAGTEAPLSTAGHGFRQLVRQICSEKCINKQKFSGPGIAPPESGAGTLLLTDLLAMIRASCIPGKADRSEIVDLTSAIL
jgi:hypothetical protein